MNVAHGAIAAMSPARKPSTATRTSPAPLRNAALAHRAGAPSIPVEPPMTSTRPKSPLWASRGRGGRRGIFVMSCRTGGCMAHSIDHGGKISRAEAVVDIDHGRAGRARVEHGQERGETVKAGAIANAGGHADHRRFDQSAHDAHERALHARDHND